MNNVFMSYFGKNVKDFLLPANIEEQGPDLHPYLK